MQVVDGSTLLRIELHGQHHAAGVEVIAHTLEQGKFRPGVLLAALGELGHAQDAAFDGLEIRQRQLGVDDVDVTQRIDVAADVHDVVVLETAHHHADGIGLADVGEKLVAQPLALRGAGDQPGDIDEFHGGGHHALRLDDLREPVEARVRHRHDTDVRIDGAERVVLRLDARLGQGVEQGGLAHVGQPDDTAFHAHIDSAGCVMRTITVCQRVWCAWRTLRYLMVCRSFIAASTSPARRRGRTSMAASIAWSISRRSSAVAGFSTWPVTSSL